MLALFRRGFHAHEPLGRMPSRREAGTTPKEVRQDDRGELGLGSSPPGPRKVSRPQMKSESLVPIGGE